MEHLMKRIGAIMTATVVAVSLSACGGYKADRGTVIEHVYEPSYSYTNCIPSGKTTICTPVFVKACWKVRVEDEAGHRGSYCLKQTAWEQIELGQYLEIK